MSPSLTFCALLVPAILTAGHRSAPSDAELSDRPRSWEVSGDVPGEGRLTGANLRLVLDEVPLTELSRSEDAWPATGGRRVCVYFDTDERSQGAEYCGYLYRDALLLKRASDPGLFNISVDALPLFPQAGGCGVWIPAELFAERPYRIWTTRLPARDAAAE